ncbi:ParA family protein [Candidatus Kirkpatrickella diaphorinae]|uniref:ParA family protein n=1 Tax=Candidatus Kirkpatrickella diaphorinae TaxID=2984322 RepID=UPI0030B953DA
MSIRTITNIRSISHNYSNKYNYDYIIFDTSPSLGALNKNILTLADAFLIPCTPDLFSVYGIRNIGESLRQWKKQFETVYEVISEAKRDHFPQEFVKLIGYTIYNAKRYDGPNNNYRLAQAHKYYADKIPKTIEEAISQDVSLPFADILKGSIGNNSVIHTHNTFPSMSQKYHVPMWKVPVAQIDPDEQNTVRGNSRKFFDTKDAYTDFAYDVLQRLEQV